MANNSWRKNVVIPGGSDQPLVSDISGQRFFLKKGDAIEVADESALTLDNDRASFKNSGTASSTGDASTVSLEANKNSVLNDRHGTIQAEDTGIEISGQSARISNAGDIVGDVNGVNFSNGGVSSGSLSNFGTISSDSRAVNIGGDGVLIRNSGRIEGTDDQRNGTIYTDGSADNFTIANYRRGEIDAGEGNKGAGIAAQIGDGVGDVVEGRIINHGEISGRGQGDASSGLSGDGLRFFAGVSGEEQTLTTFDGNILNSGTISSEGESGATSAIRFSDGLAFDGRITNTRSGVIDGENNGLYFGDAEHDATVKNFGTIQSGSRAVNIDGSDVDIHNFGKILGADDQRNGTIYSDGTAEDFSIYNGRRGVIDAGEGNNGAGVSLQIGDTENDVVDASLTNLGTIQGRGDASSGGQVGDGVRAFSGNAEQTTTLRGDIVNNGDIFSGSSVSADGIEIQGTLFEFEGDVINNGSIEGEGFGVNVSVDKFDGDILNNSRGKIEAELNSGIAVNSDEANANVVNKGEISAESGIGIEIDSRNFNGLVENRNLINAEEGIVVEGDDFDGILSNSGNIFASDVGIAVQSEGTFVGQISNFGSIEANRDGISTSSGVVLDGIIVNEGSIKAGSRGVNIDGDGVDLVNTGTILGTGDQRNGVIYTNGSADNFEIQNEASGLIDAGEGNNGAGISLQIGNTADDVVNGSVNNFGTIQARGGEIVGNLVGDGIRVFSGATDGETTFQGNIFNGGTVIAGDTVTSNGIEVDDLGLNFQGDIINAGTVTTSNGLGVFVNVNEFDGNIINEDNSLIEAGGDGIQLVASESSNDNGINNVANIGEITSNFGSGIEVRGGNLELAITNANTITASDGIVLDVETFSGGVANDGVINASDDGIVITVQDTAQAAFTNAGVINAGGDGFSVNGSAEFNSFFQNQGTINAGSRGVNLDGNRTEFSNEGTILGTGDQRNGTIYVNGTAEDFVIQNEATGVIDAGEGNNGAGISAQIGDVVGDAVSALINNLGTIQGRGDASGNTAGDGVRIFSGVSEGALPSYSGDIENEGTILSGTGSLADGIDIQGVTFRGDIQNSGTIEAFGFGAGINVQDAAFSGDITTSGRISSLLGDGIVLGDGNNNASLQGDIVVNAGGTVLASESGIVVNDIAQLRGDIRIEKTGLISTSGDGIELKSGGSFLGSIDNSGNLAGNNNGIKIGDIGAFTVQIVNSGVIQGDFDNNGTGSAIEASAATVDLDITNNSIVVGDVILGSGNDTFDSSQGTVEGNARVEGRDGNDVLISGGIENVTLDGGAGDDVLGGGSANGTLIGGEGEDTFVFSNERSIEQTVRDFTFEEDLLDVSDFFGNAHEALSASVQDGNDTVINVATGSFVVLEDVDLEQLTANDFTF